MSKKPTKNCECQGDTPDPVLKAKREKFGPCPRERNHTNGDDVFVGFLLGFIIFGLLGALFWYHVGVWDTHDEAIAKGAGEYASYNGNFRWKQPQPTAYVQYVCQGPDGGKAGQLMLGGPDEQVDIGMPHGANCNFEAIGQ